MSALSLIDSLEKGEDVVEYDPKQTLATISDIFDELGIYVLLTLYLYSC